MEKTHQCDREDTYARAHVCVCVCVCVRARALSRSSHNRQLFLFASILKSHPLLELALHAGRDEFAFLARLPGLCDLLARLNYPGDDDDDARESQTMKSNMHVSVRGRCKESINDSMRRKPYVCAFHTCKSV